MRHAWIGASLRNKSTNPPKHGQWRIISLAFTRNWHVQGADGKALGRQSALMAFPHLREGRLQMKRESSGVEQRAAVAIALKFRLDRGEHRRVARKSERALLVSSLRIRHPLRPSGG